MAQSEPPLPSSPPNTDPFFIGRDSHGNWVVQDRHKLRGGLFVDRDKALKFALSENGNRPQAIFTIPGVFELDMSGAPEPTHALLFIPNASRARRAA